ncbi:DUF1126 PH-like domain-containing protein [Ditylenchus destructor]|uniref:DUF1126 PH-like domain-containing protein n=1 Tax=Ditylenchus destructor TaxID=166010 RepID=A0AAD4N3W1_9BILA|nr:DUF1126 PH-like domain-containing protein [Ditylenchus destructor]
MPRSASADFYDPLHKANLCFVCYLNDSDGEQGELLKIRPMKLIYHLDDETISLNEPYMENSGHVQGRVFYRQKVPKYKEETVGLNYVTWKDLKVGEDINLFGKVYRLVSCDAFTKNFLHDRGIVMQDNDEGIPIDPWNHNRHFGPRFYAQAGQLNELQKLHIGEDTNLRSWEDMPKTLAFHVAWLDARNDFYGARLKRTFRMLVNTHDDSVTLTETTPGFNDALFLRNAQLPYVTIDGRRCHYRAAHMRPGSWIDIYKRPMFIFACDGEETAKFIKQQYGDIDYGHYSIELLEKGPPPDQMELCPAQLVFCAENREFPSVNFLVVYDFNSRRVDICEEGRNKKWTKGRPFLVDVDASHLNVKNLRPGASISLFRWDFALKDAHPDTKKYLGTIESIK